VLVGATVGTVVGGILVGTAVGGMLVGTVVGGITVVGTTVGAPCVLVGVLVTVAVTVSVPVTVTVGVCVPVPFGVAEPLPEGVPVPFDAVGLAATGVPHCVGSCRLQVTVWNTLDTLVPTLLTTTIATIATKMRIRAYSSNPCPLSNVRGRLHRGGGTINTFLITHHPSW
jgi:hypothetical protein